jgi:6-phosphogluconolactonase
MFRSFSILILKKYSFSIFFFLIIGFSSFYCKSPKFENACDTTSKSYRDLVFIKALTGDKTPPCSFSSILAPTGLTYPSSVNIFTQYKSITSINPNLSGGTPSSCTANPSLPNGLNLDPSNCSISGIPTVGTRLTTYTITAANNNGSTSGEVTIQTLFGLGKYLYVANYSSHDISAFSINANTGNLTPVNTTGSGTNTRDLAIDPTGNFLYSVDMGMDSIRVHTINQTTGALGLPFSTLAAGIDPKTVTIHPNGKFVYAVDIVGTIHVYSVNLADGTLTTASTASVGTNAVWMRIHPTGKFAYVARGGPPDEIYAYSIDSTTGALSQIGSPVATGTDPRSIAIDPTGKFLYCADFNVTHLALWSIDQVTGALSGGTFVVPPGLSPQSVAVHPNGGYVFVAHTSGGDGMVSGYAINSSSGSLTFGNSATSVASNPNRLLIDPSGKFAFSTVYAANVLSYTIDPSTGAISIGGTFAAGTNPNGIIITGSN